MARFDLEDFLELAKGCSTYPATFLNKIQRALTLSSDFDSFSGNLTAQLFDTNGALVSPFCPTETGVRVAL